jgi:methylmalonyl-CoA/ethylmalonyl-CoA epimerase
MQHHYARPESGGNRPRSHDRAAADDDVKRPGIHSVTLATASSSGDDACNTRRMDVIQIAQHADDLHRARSFYERLLGAQPAGLFDPPGLLFFRAGDVRLLLEPGATSALIYLKVDDVRETIESLRSDGVEIVAEPHVIFSHTDDSLGPAGMDEWMAFVKDSEGNTVGLVSHHKPEPA